MRILKVFVCWITCSFLMVVFLYWAAMPNFSAAYLIANWKFILILTILPALWATGAWLFTFRRTP
jgi:hypothetical protein